MASGEPRSQQVDVEEIIDSMKQRVRVTDGQDMSQLGVRPELMHTDRFVPRNC